MHRLFSLAEGVLVSLNLSYISLMTSRPHVIMVATIFSQQKRPVLWRIPCHYNCPLFLGLLQFLNRASFDDHLFLFLLIEELGHVLIRYFHALS